MTQTEAQTRKQIIDKRLKKAGEEDGISMCASVRWKGATHAGMLHETSLRRLPSTRRRSRKDKNNGKLSSPIFFDVSPQKTVIIIRVVKNSKRSDIKGTNIFLSNGFVLQNRYWPDAQPISIFMAGSPGAGKTEFSKRLIKKTTSTQ